MNEVVKLEGTEAMTPVVGGIESVSKTINDRIALLDRVHTLLQQRIDPVRDLKKIGQQFRRTINFARVCRRVVGGDIIYRRDPKSDLPYKRTDYQDDAGQYYVYTCSCVWRLPWGEQVEGLSLVSSRDGFFGVEDDEYKEQSEVNEAHIAQKSVTEAFKQAVFVGLGFPKDVTEDELRKFGVDGSKTSGHSFDAAKGNRGGSRDTSQQQKDERSLIQAGCKQLFDAGWASKSGEVPATPEDVLRILTANPDKGWMGWKKFAAISEKQLGYILKAVNAEVEDFIGLQNKDTNSSDPIDQL